MSLEVDLAPGASAGGDRGPRRWAAVRYAHSIWRETVADQVIDGRLRTHGWPRGLRALVGVGLAGYVVASTVVLVSSYVRAHAVLAVQSYQTIGTPASLIWLLIFLVVFALALAVTAALHGPWWLAVPGLVISVITMSVWGFRAPGLGGSTVINVLVGVGMAALLVLFVVRRRRRFAWWEFPLVFGLLAGSVFAGLLVMREGRRFGFDFASQTLLETVDIVTYLVLPAALSAGVAVAEITVRGTIVAARLLAAGRGRVFAHPATTYVVLAVLVAARIAQSVGQVVHRDPVRQGWLVLLPALALVGLMTAVCAVLFRLARGRGELLPASELPEQMGRISLPVSIVLLAQILPLTLGLFALQIVIALLPSSAARSVSLAGIPIASDLTDPTRILVGLVLIAVAVRSARRGRLSLALLLGCTGAVLVCLGERLITGNRWSIYLDPDMLNLLGTTIAVGLTAWYVLRRQLTVERAGTLAALLILSALFSYRDFVSDPVGHLIGYSGAALVLFGLTWDFLTSSDWANRDGRRVSRPTRVLIVLSNSVLTVAVLAYQSAVRNPDASLNLDAFAELGNLVFGTALLAAVFAAAVQALVAGRRIG